MVKEMEHKPIKPSFFKVLIGDFSKKLKIPPAFTKNFHGSSLGKSIVKSPNGECWVVQMEKDVNGLSFGGGWTEFVNHHSLEIGDFLVFKYHGDSKFSVKIFGKTSCEKVKGLAKKKNDCPNLQSNNGNQNQASIRIEKCKPENCEADKETEAMYSDKNSPLRSAKKRVVVGVDRPTKRSALSFKDVHEKVEVLTEMKNDNPTFCSKNENQNQARVTTPECKLENCKDDCENYAGEYRRLRSEKKHDIGGVDKLPTRSALSFKSENSCFISSFKMSNKYHMTIPRQLVREKNLEKNKKVKLKDPSGRSWQVKLYIRPSDGRLNMTEGWREFWKGNRIQVYDALIFEFMESSVMQVHIFREEGSKQFGKSQLFNAAKVIKIEAE